jgi:hypothetical protein
VRSSDSAGVSRRTPTLPVIVVLVVGLGLAVAPLAFGMFDRAPKGGDMIDEFRPYMTPEEIGQFRSYLDEIGAANEESLALREQLEAAEAVADYDTDLALVVKLNDGWVAIRDDMTDLLDRMDANLDSYDAVASLPPFPLFPWFFVIPGLTIAGVAASVIWSRRHGHRATKRLWVLVGFGVALILAPVVFQMFTRAPKGRDMIDDFRPMMTRERVQAVQGYFITLGGAEGQLRTKAVPLLETAGTDPADFPAIAQFSADWPTIVGDFNPMVATMSDNVDNFQAVDALPSFDLFPWFFVIPGALVAGLAVVAIRQRGPASDAPGSSLRREQGDPS